MATRQIKLFGGSNEIDLIDLVALVVFPAMAGMIYGIFTFTVDVFNFSLTDVAFTLAGYEITWAAIIAVASIAWIVVTNEVNQSDYDQWEYGVIAFAFLAIPAYLYIPQFTNLVDGSPWIQIGLWVLVSAAAVYVSYTE